MEPTGQLTGVSTDLEFQYEATSGDEEPVEVQEEEPVEVQEEEAQRSKARELLLKAALRRRDAQNQPQAPPPQSSTQGT